LTFPLHRSLRAVRFLLLALLLLSPLPLLAQDWHYRVRPGDTLWDLATHYLKPEVEWERLQRHNRVDDPYRLPPGTQLGFPVAWLRVQPVPARVVAVRGPVQAGTAAGRGTLRALKEGDLLRIGEEIETGADASVTLEFADASRLQLREGSRLRLDQLSRYGRTGMVDTRLRLEQGRASNRVTPARGPASRYIIDAPTATSSVRGTVFRVSAGQDGQGASTEVVEGRVQVGNRAGQRLVAHGQATRTPSALIRPGTLEALLPAPSLEVAQTRLEPLPARLAWAPVDGATGYRIEVVRADQPDVLLAAQDSATTTATFDDLPAGTLRVLVRAVSADGVEGLETGRDFTVRDQPVAPLTVRPRHDETVNSTRPRFEWGHVPDAASSVLQIASDPQFISPLLEQDTASTHLRPAQPLPPGAYYWRVASRDRNGHQGPFGQALPLTLTDTPIDPALQPPEAAKGQLTLRWQAGEPGQRYRVQLDRKGDFAQPLLDREVDQPEVTLKRPWHGTLHVRVQYIEDDGYAGPFSAPQQVKLPCRTCYGAGGGALLLWLLL
jgi:hypothetical protein